MSHLSRVALVAGMLLLALACGGGESPAPGSAEQGCEPGTQACMGNVVAFCEGGGYNAVEDCNERTGGVFLCVEFSKGQAECRQAE